MKKVQKIKTKNNTPKAKTKAQAKSGSTKSAKSKLKPVLKNGNHKNGNHKLTHNGHNGHNGNGKAKVPGQKKRILLVEDDALVSKAYAYFINRVGYIVDVAMNVIEARKRIASNHPDVILLDIIMPGINGFEFLKELKKNPELRKVPVIMISNLYEESAIIRCRRLGAADYLIKSNVFMRDVIARIDDQVFGTNRLRGL